jgi:hypothetical protein
MLRLLEPTRVVEVGSGFSSAVMLDTRERFLDPGPWLTLVEPHPERLDELLRPGDHEQVTIIPESVQQVPFEVFTTLGAGDVLFIDSTHVVRIGSDVNYLIFEVLPRLRAGVHVHFHDIFWPFEYPRSWVEQGIYWSEAYLVRALLMGSARRYQVRVFNTWLDAFHGERMARLLPLTRANPGASLWLRVLG